jgi:hypothetical protein
VNIRTRICLIALLVTPLLAYWNAIFSTYGIREDYAHIRVAREEPGELVDSTATRGRVLNGALLDTSFAKINSVDELIWLRLGSVGLLLLAGIAIWRQLDASGWQEVDAAAVGLGVTLLPAAQVIASWAILWPFALAVLMSIAGFSAVESELVRGGPKRTTGLVGAWLLYCGAALVYQPGALFGVVLVAGTLLVSPARIWGESKKTAALHLLVMLAGLLTAFIIYQTLYSGGVFSHTSRMQLEHAPFAKLGWFLWQPLPNALALLPLRDNFHAGEWMFWPAVLGVLALLNIGMRRATEREGSVGRQRWIICLAILPLVASVMCLVSSDRAQGYREHYSLAALFLLLVLAAWRQLSWPEKIRPWIHYTGIGVLMAAMAVLAGINTHSLLAAPQSREWDLMRTAVMRTNFKGASTRFYVIEPTIEDRSTRRIHADEFGALSSFQPSVAREMFKAAMHDRFPDGLPRGQQYEYASGKQPPPEEAADVVIDLRKLKRFR